jgi:hypothetical protein
MSKLFVDNIASKTGGTDALTIDSSGRILQPNKPAACFHYTGGNLAGAVIIPLNVQSVLQGGMTMSSNAITVPVNGLYMIGWHHLNNNTSAYTVVFVRINGNINGVIPNGWANQNKTSHSNSSFAFHTIAPLSANDTVDFYVNSGTIHGNADYNSMFVYLIG